MGKYRRLAPYQRRVRLERVLSRDLQYAVVALPAGVVACVTPTHIYIYEYSVAASRVIRTVLWAPTTTANAECVVLDAKYMPLQNIIVVVHQSGATVVPLGGSPDIIAPMALQPPPTDPSAADSNGIVALDFAPLHRGAGVPPRGLAGPWQAATSLPSGRIAGHGIDHDRTRWILTLGPCGGALTKQPLSPLIDPDAPLGAVGALGEDHIIVAERYGYCMHVLHIDSGALVVTLVASKLNVTACRISTICVTTSNPPHLIVTTSTGRAYGMDAALALGWNPSESPPPVAPSVDVLAPLMAKLEPLPEDEAEDNAG